MGIVSRARWPLGSRPHSSAFEQLRFEAEKRVKDKHDPQPRFHYRIGWSKDYNALFREEYSEVTSIDTLLSKAVSAGRVILTARGGGAKTVILNRIAKRALDRGHIPIFIDLKTWNEQTWSSVPEEDLLRAAFLLRTLATPAVQLSDLDSLPSHVKRLLIVDGLNEVPPGIGNSVLVAIDLLVRRTENTSTIVSDRLLRRSISNEERWLYATIQPLAPEEIAKHVSNSKWSTLSEQQRSLLASPYFLNQYIIEGKIGSSAAKTHNRFFVEHVNLTPEQLNEVSVAAFDAYQHGHSRTFDVRRFIELASRDVWDALEASGVVKRADDRAFFEHHLRHDYLASVFLATDSSRWNPPAFNVITFGASSFDAITYALEQLDNAADADQFVRRVYDWNPYAAAYAIAEGLRREAVRVTREMQLVILAMLAERRWDIVEASALRASDALGIFPSLDAKRLANADTLEGIFEYLSAVQNGPIWFLDWRSLFTTPLTSDATPRHLDLLTDEDSILGWTAANVLKRMRLSEEQLRLIIALLQVASPTTRWRIVHVLGAFPSRIAADVLIARVTTDSDEWVRYGAIRSLVELAARASSELRRYVFTQIANAIGDIVHHRRTIDELSRAVFIGKAPDDWLSSVAIAMDALRQASVDDVQLQRWLVLASDLEKRYGRSS